MCTMGWTKSARNARLCWMAVFSHFSSLLSRVTFLDAVASAHPQLSTEYTQSNDNAHKTLCHYCFFAERAHPCGPTCSLATTGTAVGLFSCARRGAVSSFETFPVSLIVLPRIGSFWSCISYQFWSRSVHCICESQNAAREHARGQFCTRSISCIPTASVTAKSTFSVARVLCVCFWELKSCGCASLSHKAAATRHSNKRTKQRGALRVCV
jgi:hypothetical protein